MRKILLFAALALATGWWPGVAWPQAGSTMPPTPVIVSKATAVTETPKLAYTGVLEPYVKAQVSADGAGRVTSINHRVGDEVKRGQVMALLTNPSLELELEVLNAHVRQGEAVVAQARQKLERTRELFEKNLAPAESYEDLAAAFQVAAAG
ncbi:MAG TPA: biotin/lipoyl-binding protein, partial [bacterium]